MRQISIKNDSILIGSNIKRIREQKNMKPKDLLKTIGEINETSQGNGD